MNNFKIVTAAAVLLVVPISSPNAGDESRFTRIAEDWQDPIYRQYDFWIGLYDANWRFKNPEEFFHPDRSLKMTHWVYPTLGGKALLEFAMSDYTNAEGARWLMGFSVRYFDSEKERWVMAQEWPNPNSTGGVLDQLQGFYRFGRIQVFSTFSTGDPPAEQTRRYTFSDVRPEGFIWHGGFTGDNGSTWTAGPLVEFSKIEPEAEWPASGQPFSNYDNASQCGEDAYRAFDDLTGEWKGTVTRDSEKSEAVLTGYHMIGGCGVLSYLEFEKDGEPYTLLEVRSPYRDKPEWWVYGLDSRHGTPHSYQAGNFEDGLISFYDNNHFVIEDEFKNLTVTNIDREDEKALKKTVWTEIGLNALAFEWWTRETPDAEWEIEAEFRFIR